MDIGVQIESKLKLLHIAQKAGVVEQVRRLNYEIIELYVLHAILTKREKN